MLIIATILIILCILVLWFFSAYFTIKDVLYAIDNDEKILAHKLDIYLCIFTPWHRAWLIWKKIKEGIDYYGL